MPTKPMAIAKDLLAKAIANADPVAPQSACTRHGHIMMYQAVEKPPTSSVAAYTLPTFGCVSSTADQATIDMMDETVIEKGVTDASQWLSTARGKHGVWPVRIDYDIAGFETAVFSYCTDIISLQGGHKRYLYGPSSILVAHPDHKYVTVIDLLAAVDG
ncbi:hypothetical protein B0A48_17610 [Cryoendolithus antarcticus]|uniref:Uncharacterized protein n=1 Tax=Cryoendolithus antarcticus TaxID=1507870 RepID=A0A1V8SAW5_9PEZI|nr:hypothetical protein B0A48_17610 [Cryoendolithus antarcticus]